ncbi:macro domain-containing protein [Youngiibacter multivorans]|uniref:O-acetyl-ADP-ribose deacetylase (Regulator of RNase III) n=1 Tax=Youngiibacter multivorans TaxID=937251 RepID=A0ABS4G024_9CLOT|nr:O-acetyl-ADP-ribose deacetylase (regulator of RNase III) [Youngiibacter multivorans]
MPLEIIRNDIIKVTADAIVNPTNSAIDAGGGVDLEIHKAAGPLLAVECRTLGELPVGQARITKGYDLPARYVIHTAGPVWRGGNSGEEGLLKDSYRSSLNLAREYGLESIAFPLISSGSFGYPKDLALRTAISVIGEFLLSNDMTVYLVVYDRDSFMLSNKLFSSITQYIDEKYVEEKPVSVRRRSGNLLEDSMMSPMESQAPTRKSRRSLDEVIGQMDETFSRSLIRLIDEKKLKDTDVYKKANVDRKLFSKIRNDVFYKPSKATAIAFAIALELNLDETRDLLMKAGFALSNSSKSDLIIQYFLERGIHNIFEINEALYGFGQAALGE